MKPSIFRRLLPMLRQQRRVIKELKRDVATLQVSVRQAERDKENLQRRLESVVAGRVDYSPLPNRVSLSIDVDIKKASRFSAVWEEAFRQLREALQRKMGR